ncbi:MAG: NifB/NifX family molybdenum-iron cluster-binding protein [Ignavibacteriae bacterium]|nr:hypothetical protein [Ignavibacteriota bacterium]NOG98649.1 NifB/NifX family molybdenum-iron cluster-binding protein [Ignavibacteriota bacterium]
MKIAICISERDNVKEISNSLSSADYYVIIDSSAGVPPDKIYNSHSNENLGAEIFCSQLLISSGINKVVCRDCEPDAERLFKDAKIEVEKNYKPYLNILSSKITDKTKSLIQ